MIKWLRFRSFPHNLVKTSSIRMILVTKYFDHPIRDTYVVFDFFFFFVCVYILFYGAQSMLSLFQLQKCSGLLLSSIKEI